MPQTWASHRLYSCCPVGCPRYKITRSQRGASKWDTSTWLAGAIKSRVGHGKGVSDRRVSVLHDFTAVACLVSRSSCHACTRPALAAGFQTVPPFCPSTTDTPGLLNRAEEDRNAMERLTLACLQHLPTAVLFVVDLTGECGTTVANQWHIR